MGEDNEQSAAARGYVRVLLRPYTTPRHSGRSPTDPDATLGAVDPMLAQSQL